MTQRRLTFQLAPLVDLLLIVIFAQYMEVQQSAADGRADPRVPDLPRLSRGPVRHAVLFCDG